MRKQLLRLALLVVLERLLDLEHRERAAGLVGERDAISGGSRVDGEADRKRPRQAAREVHLVDDALVVGLAHEALERRERARGEHVEVGELPRREHDDLERAEVVGRLAGAVDERAAVRRDQAVGRDGRHALTCGRNEPELLELRDHASRRLLRREPLRVDDDLGVLRRLVRVVDAREALDLAGERLRVEAVHVAARALVERGPDVDLDERAVLLDQRACVAARLGVRRDRRDDDGAAVARDPRGDPAEPLDVRVAVLLREAEALREVRANRVAVQVLDDEAAPVHLGADVVRDRRLPGARRAP